MVHTTSTWQGGDLNIWHHLVGVSNITGTTLYYDTDLKISTPLAGGQLSHTNIDWVIGRGTSGDDGVNGIIDEVRIYKRALSPDEITKLFNLQVF